MAATRLIPMHVNKGKTIAQSLGDRTDYAKNPEKTDKGELVTGYQSCCCHGHPLLSQICAKEKT